MYSERGKRQSVGRGVEKGEENSPTAHASREVEKYRRRVVITRAPDPGVRLQLVCACVTQASQPEQDVPEPLPWWARLRVVNAAFPVWL